MRCNSRRQYGDAHGRQRGAAFIEFALVFPILILFIFGVVDLARWVNLHFTVSRIVYEGARYAANARSLEARENPLCVTGVYNAATQHGTSALVLGRISRLLEEHFGDDAPQRTLARYCVQRHDPTGENFVDISVSVPFEPFMMRFGFNRIEYLSGLNNLVGGCSSSAKAPYLYPAEI